MQENNKISLETLIEIQGNLVQVMAESNDIEKIEILLNMYQSLERLKQFAS